MKNPSQITSLEISQKALEFVLDIRFFAFKKFAKKFREYITMENPSYKNENIERKYLGNRQKNQFLKVKNSLSDFVELKDREVKIEREIRELFFKPSIVSKDDMDKYEQKN